MPKTQNEKKIEEAVDLANATVAAVAKLRGMAQDNHDLRALLIEALPIVIKADLILAKKMQEGVDAWTIS